MPADLPAAGLMYDPFIFAAGVIGFTAGAVVIAVCVLIQQREKPNG